jgi:hypothetical protein
MEKSTNVNKNNQFDELDKLRLVQLQVMDYLTRKGKQSELNVDTHEQSSWYFKTQASPDLKLRLK